MKGGYLTVGDWRGAPVRLHWTLPIGAYLFGQGRFAPGSWLGFVLVVLLHEIGHARVVRRYGFRVVSIDVHALGGVCRWAGEPTPVQRARIACGGVNVQVVLLFATVLALWLLGPAGTPMLDQLAGAFTVVNGWILVLNLIPVHPLDGAEIWKLPGLLRRTARTTGTTRTTTTSRTERDLPWSVLCYRTAVARLTWALLLSIALVAPDLAAKPAKRAKAEKGDRSEKQTPAGGVSFTIARPENAGMMNTIPLRLVIEPRDGIMSSKLTHLGQPKAPPKDKDKGLLLIGGDAVDMSVRPGTFSVKAVTPVELQPSGYHGTHKPRAWESAVVKVQLERGEVITLVVEPGVTGADYDGSWHIGKAAPPEPDGQADDASNAPARD